MITLPKTILKTVLLFTICSTLAVFNNSCDESENLLTERSAADCSIDTSNVVVNSLPCDSAITLELLAGQTIPVGSVSIHSDGTNLTVVYTTTGGWVMDETHLFVGNCSDVPLNAACNPKIGQFPYSEDHIPGVSTYAYVIPLSSIPDCFCFIAHAAVSNAGLGGGASEETAFANGENELPGDRWGWFSIFCQEECDPSVDSCFFRTQTQGGWGSVPSGNNPGSYLHDNFDGAFPSGITIGCANTVTLNSAQAVTDFLPQGGGPLALTAVYVDPTSPLISTLAGNLLAVSLALGFDSYDSSFGLSSGYLGDLIITSGTFSGWTLTNLVDEANLALGGCSSSYGLSELNDALANASSSFTDGDTSSGFLACP
ncbi:MAG: hypothetical protein HON99_12770 [Crocinitomicaceae bacterium]|nr:hypothetical protein [Crocinitomicaceae bacterium]